MKQNIILTNIFNYHIFSFVSLQLKIKAFREAHKNQQKDKELYHLTKYLKKIAKLDDFTSLNHKHWQSYINR